MRRFLKLIKKFSTTVMAFAMMAVVVFGTCACHAEIEDEITSESESALPPENHLIRLTYNDESYTAYFERCAKAYMEKHDDVRILLNLVDSSDYLQMISDTSLSGTNMTDVYYLECDSLGTAYLAGLAEKNTQTAAEQYCEVALQACSVGGNLVAYPLSYKTSFLAYNAKYVPKNTVIKSFEDIKAFAGSIFDEGDAAEGEVPVEEESGTEIETPIDYSKVETIFECNLSDLFVNYGFIGGGMIIGGRDGSDKDEVQVCTEESMAQAQSYLDLINYFSISKTRTYQRVYERFLEGKTIFTIMTTDSLAALELEHELAVAASEEDETAEGTDSESSEETNDTETFDYGIMAFPNYDEKTQTAALSLTDSLVVNPYSKEQEIAQDFACYATSGMANYLYVETGKLSAKGNVHYSRKVLSDAYEAYAHSVPKNKLQYGEQIYPLIEIALHNIVAGENIEDQLTAVDTYMATQIQ